MFDALGNLVLSPAVRQRLRAPETIGRGLVGGSPGFSILGLGCGQGWCGCRQLHQALINLFRWARIVGPHCSQGLKDKIGGCPQMEPPGYRDTEVILMNTFPHSSTTFLAFSLSPMVSESFFLPINLFSAKTSLVL